MAENIPTNKARQGRGGLQVLVVLIAALLLAAIAWFAAEFFGEAIDTQGVENPAGQVQSED